MASKPVGRTRDHFPRHAKSVAQSPATSLPSMQALAVIDQKIASGAYTITQRCCGCDTRVKHINKHLSWKPDCRRFYNDEILKQVSIESRKEAKKKYDLAHEKEIKSKKAIYYKEKMQGHVKIGSPEKSGNNATTSTHEKMPSHLWHVPPADLHDQNICSICEKSFTRQDKLVRHLKEVHDVYKLAGQEKARSFACPSCNETFSRKETMMRHFQTKHQKSLYTCSVCNKEFSRKDSLQRHMNEVHKEEKRFKCPDCPLTFSRKEILEDHLKKTAKNKELHGCVKHCNLCNKDILFSSMKAYKDHSWLSSCKTIEAEKEKERNAWAN